MNQNYGTFPESGTIQFNRLLPGPIDRVWDYLTKSELKGKWLAAGDVQPRVGGNVDLYFKHKNLSEADDPIPEKYKNMEEGVHSTGRVTRYDPPRLLSYTWGEENGEESEVTFELIPKENNKVLLILTHRRLGDDRDTLAGVAAGWHTHLGILVDNLEGRNPSGFWSMHEKLEEEYRQAMV